MFQTINLRSFCAQQHEMQISVTCVACPSNLVTRRCLPVLAHAYAMLISDPKTVASLCANIITLLCDSMHYNIVLIFCF